MALAAARQASTTTSRPEALPISARGSWGATCSALSSSYFEGTHCPLAKIGHNRDGKKNKLQVNYGLLTNRTGCPVAVSVYEGNTGDAKTLIAAGEQAP